jgi:glycosyltransferase involved in cell wall biosynthesis
VTSTVRAGRKVLRGISVRTNCHQHCRGLRKLRRDYESCQTNAIALEISGQRNASNMTQAVKVLLGPITHDKAESVGIVNETLIDGLQSDFCFIPHVATRSRGIERQGRFNAGNLYYMVKHALTWAKCLPRRPDIAHYAITSGWNLEKSLFLLRLAALFGARTVGHLHGGGFIEFWRSLPSWRRKRAFKNLSLLDALVVLSEGWKTAVVDEIGLPTDKVFVVNNPINSVYEDAALEMPILRRTENVLCMGVMDRLKGVFEILDAAAALKGRSNVKFQLVGPEREPGILRDVENAVRSRGLHDVVHILGPADLERKIDLFRDAAIFLLPSHVENFPLTVIEAAAAGLPIITTPIGATPEFFEDGRSALFVEKGNSSQIAELIEGLLDSGEKRTKLGYEARTIFTERLGRARIMDSMRVVYYRLVSHRRFSNSVMDCVDRS